MSEPIPPCAKCGHEKLYVIDPVKFPDFTYSNAAEIFPVHSHGAHRAGNFEARVCRRCGFTEWYARNMELLGRLTGAGGVTLVTAGGDGYR